MAAFVSYLARGAIAGAAGTAALNATTYLDMAVRGRSSSSTPEDTVTRMADVVGTSIPGDDAQRRARLSGIGALLGISAGVATGAVLGAAQSAGLFGSWKSTVGPAWVLAMLAGNVPMTALGVTDPRRWTSADWAADVVPHIAYAVVTSIALERLD